MSNIYTVKNSSGETDEVSESDLHLAEKDGFYPVVSNGKEEDVVSQKDLHLAAKDGFKPIVRPDVSMLESAGRGIAQGVTFGFADEIEGGLKSAFSDKTYEQERDAARAEYQAAEKANPIVSTGAEIAGSLPWLLVPGMGEVRGATLGAKALGMAAQGAVQGGLVGAGKSESDTVGGVLQDTASGAVVGGTLGGALPVVGAGLGKVGSYVSETVSPKLSQMAEKQAAKAIGVEDSSLGRMALDENVVGFRSNEKMANRLEDLQSSTGKAIGETRSQLEGIKNIESNKLLGNIDDKLASKYETKNLESGLNSDISNLYGKVKETILNKGEYSVQDLKSLRDEIKRIANFKKTDPNQLTQKEDFARDLYDVLTKTENDMVKGTYGYTLERDLLKVTEGKTEDEMLQMSLPFTEIFQTNYLGKEKFIQNKDRFSKLSQIKKGLEKRMKKNESGNNLLEIGAGLAATPFSVGAYLPAAALTYGGKKIGKEFGRQSLAKTLDVVSKTLESSPERLGKFAKVLNNAKKRGSAQFAVAQNLLDQTNEEYRQLKKKLEEEGK